MSDPRIIQLHQAWADHDRHWRDFAYCYPVISRRSKGLSIGVNLNPDKACNFDCIYCQVDRTVPPMVRKVDLDVVRSELAAILDAAISGRLFDEPPFTALPPEERVVRDIAFSGDGEPTTFSQFDEAVRIIADLKRECGLPETKIVLITDACYLTRPTVAAGLGIMDENNGEIWAKLDAGTQSYYEAVNRPNYPLSHVLTNILETAKARPIVIQSLWMKVHGVAPPELEIRGFIDRICEISDAGGRLKLIQVYTIARRTTEAYATPLTHGELDRIAERIPRGTGAKIEAYYGVED